MPAPRLVDQLNAQIGNELAASHQYLACAVHYDALTMPRMAAFFHAQAMEEHRHAMMIVQYLLDTDAEVRIPAVSAPGPGFEDVVGPVELALAQEREVSEQVNALVTTARAEADYASEQFLQWFVREQVEEVATMSGLLAVVSRSRQDLEDVEEYVAREHGDPGADSTAPRAFGG